MDDLVFQAAIDPDTSDVAAVDAGLHAYNLHAADFDAVRRFGCYARLGSGLLVGGALARWWGTACELQQLWVDERYRRRGIGAELVRLVERTAIDQGCTLLHLDTFTFQAPRLYARLGFEVACAIPGLPNGASRLIMRKMLSVS